jgi:hypothetical protein|tara:strand:- start:13992 stop:14828 length:837 start_codon:yes stop_codon:yes gene_type:complete
MLKVNLFDKEFIHTKNMLGYITCSDTLKPKKIEWLDGLMEYDGITVFTERFINTTIVDSVKSKIKVAWILEPRAFRPESYLNIIRLEHKFDYILTYDAELLKRSDKYLKYVVGQSRITSPKIYKKSKFLSMIASNKRTTEGHNFRHTIAKSLASKHNIEMWGSGYKRFNDKLDPLSEYHFSISVMNSKIDNFFTEILIDNFMVGTVPIFWGCPNIGEYFDERGIITFNTLNELDVILDNLTIKDYTDKLDFIQKNIILGEDYVSTDDMIADALQKIII